ncbi:MAG: glycosyltransferase [Phycisphaerales bacterium]|nr:glycosyltransferase [Phycisphaerales bacterium]
MRVLHINDYRTHGGCEVLMDVTVEALIRSGIEVERFTSEDVAGHRRTPLSYIDNHRGRGALTRQLAAFRPDVVHLHNFYHELSPGILATLRRWRRGRSVRVVMTAHDFHLICPNAGLRFFRRGEAVNAQPDAAGSLGALLTRSWDERGRAYSTLKTLQHLWNYRLLRRHRVIDAIIAPSQFMADAVARLGVPTVVIANPVPASCAADRPSTPLHLLFAGRVEPEKGLGEFIAAFPVDVESRLTIVGDGAALPAVRAEVERRGLTQTVTFAGRCSRQRTLERLATAHVLVLPSKVYENDPIVIGEALACGASLLVSDLGGMREAVRASGVGYTFDPADPAAVAATVRKVAEDHRSGCLRRTPADGYLEMRTESRYRDCLLRLYEADAETPIAGVPNHPAVPCAS